MSVKRIPITDRATWLAMRQQDVTASDVGTLFGCNPYKTPLRLWAEKTGQIGGLDDNDAMRRGRWLESAVIAACEEQEGWAVERPLLYLRDDEFRIGATPDAIATDADEKFLLQCKVVAKPVFDRDWPGEPPLGYQLQTLTEAMLWGAPRACVAALVVDTYTADLHTFPIARHAGAEAKIREAVLKFWQDTDAGREPSADYALDAETIRKAFPPRDDTEAIDLTGDNLLPELLDERSRLKFAIKEGEARCEAIDAEIIHKLNGATAGTCAGWKLSHKIQHRAERVQPATSFAVLRISKPKEKEAA